MKRIVIILALFLSGCAVYNQPYRPVPVYYDSYYTVPHVHPYYVPFHHHRY